MLQKTEMVWIYDGVAINGLKKNRDYSWKAMLQYDWHR